MEYCIQVKITKNSIFIDDVINHKCIVTASFDRVADIDAVKDILSGAIKVLDLYLFDVYLNKLYPEDDEEKK